MALSTQEKETIKKLRQEGYSSAQIEGHIGALRTGRVSSIDITKPEKEKTDSFLTDLREGFDASVDSVSNAIQKNKEVNERVFQGKTSPLEGTFETIGTGLGAGASVVGNAVLSVGKGLLPQAAEDKISTGVQGGVEAVAQSRAGQSLVDGYNNLSPRQQRLSQSTLGVAEGLTTMFGFAPVLNKLGDTLSDTAKSSLSASDDILRNTRKSTSVSVPTVATLDKFLTDFRFNISDIDPQVETVLKRSNFDEVNTYMQKAKTAAADPEKNTPLEIAGSKAEESFDAIDSSRRKAIEGKKAIIEQYGNQRVSGDVVNKTIADGIRDVSDSFGVKLRPDGTIERYTGRMSTLDSSDEKLIGEYFAKLNSMGISPTVREVDDFVDWAQSQLYKQSKTVSKLEAASEPVTRKLQGVTGQLNSRLKSEVGNGYGEVNARISHLIELQDELSRALGADARKGGGLMKTLFSPSGGNTRRIFRQIRDETGVDLFKEATLAKFAMENAGDVRQKSLLKELDVALQDATKINLAEPTSWFAYAREKADLDGQRLANEIIRRNEATSVNPDTQQ